MEENADIASVDVEDSSSFLDDEIEALQSIYINETEVVKNANSTIVSIDLHPATADNLQEQYVKMTLKLKLLDGYPEVIPEIEIRNLRGLSDEKLNSIMQDLIEIAESKRGNSMLFEIIESAKDHLTVENRPCEECAICLYGFQDDDVFTKTECYHYFHSHCLARYAKNAAEKESKCDKNDEESKDAELPCPVCRLPIHFEGSESSYPAPMREDEEIVVPNDLIEMQKKMSELYLKQVEKGGIIDIEAEKNKYLLEISQIPSVTDDTRLDDDQSHSNITQESKDNSETLPQESNAALKNKTENSQSSVARSTANADATKKGNQRNVKHNAGRTKRYNESGRDRNKHYGGGYGGNRKGDKYKDYRENEEYDEEERYERYDNRRNDRYSGERVNSRYNNDRSSNQYLGDRRNDRQNDRYYVDRRNDRYNYDRRNNRYSDDRRNDRYNGDNRNDRYYGDRRNDHYNGNRRNGRYVSDRNDQPGFNRRGDYYDNRGRNEDLDYKQKSNEDDNREDQGCDDNRKSECNEKIDHHDEDAGRENDKCDEKDQFENDRKNDRYVDKRNYKYGGYRRNDRYNGPKRNDRYDNDRRNFRFDGEKRSNYRKDNNGHNESRKNEHFNRKDVKSIEETKSSVTSEMKQQELSQSDEIEIAIDHEKSASIENAETNDSFSNCQNFPNDRQRTEVSTQSLNHKNKTDRNRGTNRQTDENNYGKQNYRKDSNKRYNVPRNYNRDYSDSTHGKPSKLQSNQIAEETSLDQKNTNKNETSESANERASRKSNTRHANSLEMKIGSKNDECGDGEFNHSNKKSSQKFHTSYNDRGMHPRRNSFRNYHEGRPERDDRNRNRNHSFREAQSSKNQSGSNNRHYNAPINSPATVNDNKTYEVPSTKSGNENCHYKNDSEIVTDKCEETNVPETISSEKLSNGSAIHSALETTKEPENPVPSSTFLPPMSSIAPPPGFLNPSRKVVYGLAAANPPPGFHRS